MQHQADIPIGEIHHNPDAKIGPNALTQTVAALRELYSDNDIAPLLRKCDQEYLLYEPVEQMVDERAFASLVAALVDTLGEDRAQEILCRSGELTAHYLLQNRIPGFFQRLLRPLPPRMAMRLLLSAISKHAWTFVGSGSFQYEVGSISQLTVHTQIHPAEAVSSFYGGTFAHLISVLVDPMARMTTSVSRFNEESCCQYTFHLCSGLPNWQTKAFPSA